MSKILQWVPAVDRRNSACWRALLTRPPRPPADVWHAASGAQTRARLHKVCMSFPSPDPSAPLFIVLNAGSGHNDSAATQATIAGVLGAAKREHRILVGEDAP